MYIVHNYDYIHIYICIYIYIEIPFIGMDIYISYDHDVWPNGPGRSILSRLTVLCRSTSCGGGTGRNSSKSLFAGSICSEVEASVNTMIV